MAFSFGLIWGLANLLFGAGISLIGMSLSFPICMGVSTALGTFIPMARHPDVFLTRGGATITLGIAVLLTGVIFCAIAGMLMDARSGSGTAGMPAAAGGGRTRRKGLAIVVLAGICDPFLNFALAFGEPVKHQAAAAGASPAAAPDAIWVIVLMGSLLVNVAYCTTLLQRNGTWSRFTAPGTAHYWLFASVMGIVWMLSITLYGRGASMLGTLGDSVGWAVFYCSIIIFSTLWGIVCGEWREGRGRPLRTLYLGLTVLIAAIVILSYGNSLTAKPATSATILPE
jgi:L-rhamnose-H+ transport protein